MEGPKAEFFKGTVEYPCTWSEKTPEELVEDGWESDIYFNTTLPADEQLALEKIETLLELETYDVVLVESPESDTEARAAGLAYIYKKLKEE